MFEYDSFSARPFCDDNKQRNTAPEAVPKAQTLVAIRGNALNLRKTALQASVDTARL